VTLALPEVAVRQQLLERLASDAPALYAAFNSAELTTAGRRNLLRFLSSAFGGSERYAAVLRNQEAIARSLKLFESSEYLTEILARHPEEIDTLAEIQSTPPKLISGKLFELPSSFKQEMLNAETVKQDDFGSGDPVFGYVANSTAAHGEKIALLRRHFRHRMFASGARDFAELRPIYSSLAETTAAAEDAITAAFRIAGAPRGLAVLALGRLGSREFDLLSDADLLGFLERRGLHCADVRPQAVDEWTAFVKKKGEGLLANEVDSWMTGVNQNVEGKQVRIVARYSGTAPEYRERADGVAAGGYREMVLA